MTIKNKTFLATTGNGLAQAERETGGEWMVEFLLKDQDVRCLAADPLNSHVIFAGTQVNGVLRSDDQGRNWQQAGLPGVSIKSLAVSIAEASVVYAGTKSPPCIFVSRDSGASWADLEG
jgi:photosystem II stability/assembly factor-like uncharacterized protein